MQRPADLHREVERLVNAGDADALAALYEPGARMVDSSGAVRQGVEAIRSNWAEIVARGFTIALETTYIIESGDLALLRNDYTLRRDGVEVGSSATAEVVRRQPDGTWLYVLDHPFGSSDRATLSG
jgi:uncharacterized protein (TIGR02246 family)